MRIVHGVLLAVLLIGFAIRKPSMAKSAGRRIIVRNSAFINDASDPRPYPKFVISNLAAEVSGVKVSSAIPGLSIIRVHVEKVEHDQTTDIHYSDYHLFVTIENQSDEDVQELWAKVCFKQAKEPVCKEVQIGGDWRKGTATESYPVPYWVPQQPTEIALLKTGTSRAKGGLTAAIGRRPAHTLLPHKKY